MIINSFYDDCGIIDYSVCTCDKCNAEYLIGKKYKYVDIKYCSPACRKTGQARIKSIPRKYQPFKYNDIDRILLTQ